MRSFWLSLQTPVVQYAQGTGQSFFNLVKCKRRTDIEMCMRNMFFTLSEQVLDRKEL